MPIKSTFVILTNITGSEPKQLLLMNNNIIAVHAVGAHCVVQCMDGQEYDVKENFTEVAKRLNTVQI